LQYPKQAIGKCGFKPPKTGFASISFLVSDNVQFTGLSPQKQVLRWKKASKPKIVICTKLRQIAVNFYLLALLAGFWSCFLHFSFVKRRYKWFLSTILRGCCYVLNEFSNNSILIFNFLILSALQLQYLQQLQGL
jgi:hypothetical protein